MAHSKYLLLPALLIMACPADKQDTSGTTLGEDLFLTDDNVYHYTAAMEVAFVEVAAWGDTLVTWEQLGTDIRGRPIKDPAQIDQAILVWFSLSQAEVLQAIGTNDLDQADIRDYRLLINSSGLTSAQLSDFSVLGNEFDPATEFFPASEGNSWAVTLWDFGEGRNDILSVMFLVPIEGEKNLQADFTDSTASLDFEVDLHSGAHLMAPVGSQGRLDWSAVTTDATGQEFDELAADRLLVGHLPTSSVSEVEASFVLLDQEMDQVYRLDVYGDRSAALSEAVDSDGLPFPGFTTSGLWIVGVDCTTCTSPAPMIASVVQVQELSDHSSE